MAIELNTNTPPIVNVPLQQGISVVWINEPWSDQRVYYRNQALFHKGSSYRANKTTTEEPSAQAADWEVVAFGIPVESIDSDYFIKDLEKGAPNGVAPLNPNAQLFDSTIPDNIVRDTELAAAIAAVEDSILVESPTAEQVGKDVAQWNADRVKGVVVDDAAKADGRVLKYNGATQKLEYAVDNSSSGGSGGATTIDELNDVVVSGPTDGEVLASDSGGWINQTLEEIGIARASTVTVSLATKADASALTAGLATKADTTALTSGLATKADASALTSHTGNTSNPHSTTAAQVGAIATTQRGAVNGVASLDETGRVPDAQIPDAITRDTELTAGLATKADTTALTSHTGNTSNPHGVTAAQVGNTTAQWNANQLQGRNVASTAPTDGQVLTYSTANTRWEPATPSAGGGGSMIYPTSYVHWHQVSTVISGNSLFTVSSASAIFGGYTFQPGASATDSFKFSAPLAAGNYQMEFTVLQTSSGGRLTCTLGGTTLFSNLDTHTPGIDSPNSIFRNITIPTSGLQEFIFTVSKNASSSGHTINLTNIGLTKIS